MVACLRLGFVFRVTVSALWFEVWVRVLFFFVFRVYGFGFGVRVSRLRLCFFCVSGLEFRVRASH